MYWIALEQAVNDLKHLSFIFLGNVFPTKTGERGITQEFPGTSSKFKKSLGNIWGILFPLFVLRNYILEEQEFPLMFPHIISSIIIILYSTPQFYSTYGTIL